MARKFLLIIVGSIGVIILAWVALSGVHELQSKQDIAQEIKALSVPTGCSETSRSYTRGDVDVSSGWDVTYSCRTTGGAAYETIIHGLAHRSYKPEFNAATVTPNSGSVFYSFIYQNSKFQVSYDFVPHVQESINNAAALQASPVTGIKLSVTRVN